MSPAEFSQWLDEHRVYPACREFRAWLTKLKRAERGEIVAAWMHMLKPISLSQGQRATKRMHAAGELGRVSPEGHIPRILELAKSLNDPEAERAREAKRAVRMEESRKAWQDLEDRFGVTLDAMPAEGVEGLAGVAFGGLSEVRQKFLWDFYRRKQGGGEDPRKSKLIREELLKELRRQEIGGEEISVSRGAEKPQTADEFNSFRQDIFAGLGNTTDQFRTNDQWDK